MVGRTVTYRAPEPVGRASIRYFSVAVGDHNPLYTDDAFAVATGWGGIVAPPTLVLESNQYMGGERDADGYPGHTWGIDIPGTHVVRGGHAYHFGRPVRPDDVLTATWTIDAVTERTSSNGRPMAIVTATVRITADDGEFLASNQETLIYQELS